MRVAIVGAGLAGLSCAQSLVDAGVEVQLFDKGRGAGGRMSSRRAATSEVVATFDHGAQYMTAKDPDFRAQIGVWAAAGVIAPWSAAGEGAWVGAPAMNAPLKVMAQALNVCWNAPIRDVRRQGGLWRVHGEGGEDGEFDVLLTALPAEQTDLLLRATAPTLAAVAAETPTEPCWAVMAAFADRLEFAPDVLKTTGVVGWAARNSAKPGRGGPEAWVIHAAPRWSRDHLEADPDRVAAELLAAFFTVTDTRAQSPMLLSGHRWRYARSSSAHRDCLWDPELQLGACGDWLLGPRVENAWISGRRLAALVAPMS